MNNHPNDPAEIFGQPIYTYNTYTRAQAIADGEQVEVTIMPSK